MESILSGIIATAIASGTVIVLAALGELLAERTGVMNLGLEGIMAMGAVTAIITVNEFFPNQFAGLAVAIGVGALLGMLFAIATVTLKANQVLAGLALSFIGTGLAGRLGAPFAGTPAAARFDRIAFGGLSELPYLGRAFFDHNLLTYLAYLILPLIITYTLYRTRHGLNVRSIGENPAAADATGINVDRLRFIYTSIGGALAAVGGAYLTLSFTPAWSEGVTGGRGWIAIALVIFAGWRPFLIVLGALLFGAVTSLGFVAQTQGWGIPSAFLSMLPYLSTILLMILPIVFRRKGQRQVSASPDALGLPYIREGT
jgi:simple sugar transport system permease protein